MRSAFTLIELLVVIGIIAILTVVVILTLTPAQLLAQSRDATRLSDLATLNDTLGVYSENVSGSLGSASTTYISVPDTAATSTLGDQCQGLSLAAFATSTGLTYGCPASSSYKAVSGAGWIPLNLTALSSGSPIGTLPVDPVNQTSSGLYYTFSTNGTQYEVTAIFESQKYKTQYSTSPSYPIQNYPEVPAVGNNLGLSALWNSSGLVGYWPFNEGAGSTTADQSGNGNVGTWAGTPAGNNATYYAGGKVGSYAGYFDGSTNYANIGSNASLNIGGTISLSAWINTKEAGYGMIVGGYSASNPFNGYGLGINLSGSSGTTSFWNGTSWVGANTAVNNGSWHFIAVSVDGTNANFYTDGVPDGSVNESDPNFFSGPRYIGSIPGYGVSVYFSGEIDDLRIYNRVLNSAEVRAMYNAEK